MTNNDISQCTCMSEPDMCLDPTNNILKLETLLSTCVHVHACLCTSERLYTVVCLRGCVSQATRGWAGLLQVKAVQAVMMML